MVLSPKEVDRSLRMGKFMKLYRSLVKLHSNNRAVIRAPLYKLFYSAKMVERDMLPCIQRITTLLFITSSNGEDEGSAEGMGGSPEGPYVDFAFSMEDADPIVPTHHAHLTAARRIGRTE